MSDPASPPSDDSSGLTFERHDRDRDGLQYVYTVLSRRARGVSVGINLNPNNACNFRCIYCQVPGLVRGNAPPIDVDRVELELRRVLQQVLDPEILARQVPEGLRRLNDVALSGNGEPTSAREFPEVVDRIGVVLEDCHVLGQVKVVLITNGSLAHRPEVAAGIAAMSSLGGEVWFKIDAGTDLSLRRVNDYGGSIAHQRRNLIQVAARCPTWVQTCAFLRNGEGWPPEDFAAYLELLRGLKAEGVPLRGVLLYGLARPSHQPEAPELGRLTDAALEDLANQIRDTGWTVRATP